MARKKVLPKVIEPDYGYMIHYAPAPGTDTVTLCGKTDWIGETIGWEVFEPVTCPPCIAIAEHFKAHINDV